MQKNNDIHPETKRQMTARMLTTCALLTAASIILARLIIPMPNVTTRFSIEAVPYFIAGMRFGPLPGALVGAAADFIGCLFSGYGFNPLFSVPPILYGLTAGIFRHFVTEKPTIFRIGLAFLPPVVFGSILYQSWALAFVYGGKAFESFFITKLATRSVQFAVTWVLETLIVFLLIKSRLFEKTHLIRPKTVEKSA